MCAVYDCLSANAVGTADIKILRAGAKSVFSVLPLHELLQHQYFDQKLFFSNCCLILGCWRRWTGLLGVPSLVGTGGQALASVTNQPFLRKQPGYRIASLETAVRKNANEGKQQHDHTASPKMHLKDNFAKWRGSQAGIYPDFQGTFKVTQLLFVPLKTSPRSFGNRNWCRKITLQREWTGQNQGYEGFSIAYFFHTNLWANYISV